MKNLITKVFTYGRQLISSLWEGIKMADDDPERIEESTDNIFEILQKQNNSQMTVHETGIYKHENSNGNNVQSKKHKAFRNLPGLHVGSHVLEENIDGDTPPDAKRPRLSGLPAVNVSDACQSPETGKRKRIQHDYRRLSNSGYLDDYVSSRERRFSSASDNSDVNMSPSPPKNKIIATSPAVKASFSSDVLKGKVESLLVLLVLVICYSYPVIHTLLLTTILIPSSHCGCGQWWTICVHPWTCSDRPTVDTWLMYNFKYFCILLLSLLIIYANEVR